MHIPDNYLSPLTCGVMTVAMVPVWQRSIKRVSAEMTRSQLPMLGIGAAFSFLMMMFNVPLPGGTTGHAVGGTLLAILMGPAAACLSITVALFIQAVMFGDGGILAFGANCFNMAFILPITGYLIYIGIKKLVKGQLGEQLGMIIGSYLALNVAALITAVEFGIQPLLFKDAAGLAMYCPYGLSVSIPAMMIPHLIVAGVVEALFTVGIVSYIRTVAPEMMYANSKEKAHAQRIWWLVGGLILATPLGLLATGTAWGEWGMEEISAISHKGTVLGYTPSGMANGFSFEAMIPDYAVAGMPEVAGYLLSAIAGVAMLIIFFKLIANLKKDPTT